MFKGKPFGEGKKDASDLRIGEPMRGREAGSLWGRGAIMTRVLGTVGSG